jgi:hypothetical protein
VLEPYVKLDRKAKAAVLEEGERLVRFAESDATAFDLKGC